MNLIANDSKKGLARARNAGVAAATAEIVAFLNDEMVARNWFAAPVALDAEPNVLGVGGQVVCVRPQAGFHRSQQVASQLTSCLAN